MNTPLTIIARIEAVAGQTEVVKKALQGLIEPTLKEAGCIQYDLHQDNDDPSVFLFYEIWETRELWQQHGESAHISAHRIATKETIASTVISEMTKI